MYPVAMRNTLQQRRARQRAHMNAARGAGRTGRVLVECCVALVLLSVCGSLVLVGAAGTATLVDGAEQEDRVQRAAATLGARVYVGACASVATLATPSFGARVQLREVHVATSALHRVDLQASWQSSALAWLPSRSVRMTTAGACE